MRKVMLPIRWSWRDLRSHIAKVGAIALVIAIGTGGYAGLTSTTEWRRVSYDASYAQLAMYDLRVDLVGAAVVEEGALAAAAEGIPSAAKISAVEERLIAPVQVDASHAAETIIVRGEMTGSDFSGGGPTVNSYHALAGRLITEADAGSPVVMLESAFAKLYGLPPTGSVSLGGDRQLDYVAHATTPEYFTVAPEGGVFMSEATFAAVFTTLETAQSLAGAPNGVNNLVLTLADGADRFVVEAELAAAVEPFGGRVATREDSLSYSALINDIDQDQAMFNALAVLLLVGAIGAAVNLIHRMVQQQRREIGIGLALGVRPWVLAIRPLLVSAQIAVLGVVFGVGVGVLIGNAMGSVFTGLIPLPVWDTSFQASAFLPVAVAGAALPLLASMLPVYNAVRVDPVEAIRPIYQTRQARRGRRARRSRRISTLVAMPLHNLTRARRRTALTVLGLAASVTVFVGFLGLVDSIYNAVLTAETEGTAGVPGRMTARLDGFYPLTSPEFAATVSATSVGAVEPTLHLAGTLRSETAELDVLIELADLGSGRWTPTIEYGDAIESRPLDIGGGVFITEKAAGDLDVAIGDVLTLRHPRREGLGYRMVDSVVPVLGTHPYPVRGVVFMDSSSADVFDLAGVTNGLSLWPAPGAAPSDVQRELFGMQWVVAVQDVGALAEAVRNAFDQLVGVISVMVVAVLVLALLIAFNTASINLESRAREHATMFAFGVRVRTALAMAMAESFVLGVVATAIGIAGGLVMVWWITQRVLTETIPEFALLVVVAPETILLAAVIGIAAVTVAPVLTLRRMYRMNLPGTLRLVE